MRISDWSSDVCSSDLYARDVLAVPPAIAGVRHGCNHRVISPVQRRGVELKTIFMRRLLRIGERIVDRHFMADPLKPFYAVHNLGVPQGGPVLLECESHNRIGAV